jgi:hypothetical protein
MVRDNHNPSKNLSHNPVFRSIQGTNQKEMEYFDSVSNKVITALYDPKIKITRKMMQFIESIDCPHLIEIMNQKLANQNPKLSNY